jgi:K+-sensing histidine kinase KdpD
MEVSLFAVIYRITIVIIGLFITYLGYLLFKSNISNQSGDLEVTFKKMNFALKNSTPGTLLTILGIVVILSGFAFEIRVKRTDETMYQQNKQTILELKAELDSIMVVKDSLAESVSKVNSKFTKKLELSNRKISELLSTLNENSRPPETPPTSFHKPLYRPTDKSNASTTSKLPKDTLKHD